MRKIFVVGVILLSLFITGNPAFALRVGNKLINVGELKHEVSLKSGEPYSKEVIGYIDRVESGDRIRVMKIEEWIIAVPLYGTTYYYSLIFEGNVLTEIKPAGKSN